LVGVDVDVRVEVGGGSMVRDKVYKSKEEKPVLVSLFNLYSELVKISIDVSKPLTYILSY